MGYLYDPKNGLYVHEALCDENGVYDSAILEMGNTEKGQNALAKAESRRRKTAKWQRIDAKSSEDSAKYFAGQAIKHAKAGNTKKATDAALGMKNSYDHRDKKNKLADANETSANRIKKYREQQSRRHGVSPSGNNSAHVDHLGHKDLGNKVGTGYREEYEYQIEFLSDIQFK